MGAARQEVRVARALATLPRLSQALARGELSYAKVTRVATPENEHRLLKIGRAGTAAHVERIVRGWRCVDRKAEVRDAAAQHKNRRLYVYRTDDGSVVVRGRLAPEVGALLIKALDATRSALYERRRGARAFPRKRLRSSIPFPRNSSRLMPSPSSPRRRCTTASNPAPRASARTLPCGAAGITAPSTKRATRSSDARTAS